MALTLVEAAKYSNDILQKGVIELLVRDDPIFDKLQFKTILGNGLTYNVETTESTAAFYDVGDTWTESTGVVTPATATTRILGGDADVDNFLLKTRSDQQDLMVEQIAAKMKAVKKAFMNTLFYGYYTGGGAEGKKFDGLHYLLRSYTYNTTTVATVTETAAALSLMTLEAAVDKVKWGKPQLMVMSKALRRKINQTLNAVGGITKTEVMKTSVQTLFDIPVLTSDYVSDDESCDLDYGSSNYGHNYADGTALGDDDNATTIFILQFDPKALCGIQSLPITTERFEKLETKDASRVRIKWYPGIMLQNILSCAKVTGISPTTTVTT